MINRLLGVLAPHYCTSCGEIGAVFCANCKYDIMQEPYQNCLFCDQLCHEDSICRPCRGDISRAWCVGERTGSLEKLLDSYKFERVQAASAVLSDMMDERLPELPAVHVVAIPTISRHIRQRGYDHAERMARGLAARRHLPYHACLRRKTNTQQRGATRRQRHIQASEAFVAHDVVHGATYVLIDDIVTTGATVRSAAKVLRAAGAGDVWVAVVARQPWTAEV